MLQGQPLISVIVPCFNHGRHLAEALESIARQTYENWECLIIDDGSWDGTPDTASHFVRRDSRYRYFHHAHKGVGASRNRGLSLARGDLIQFLDADDVVLPDKLDLQVAALGAMDSLKVIHCDYAFGKAACITEPDETRVVPPTFALRKPIYDLALRWETEMSIPIHCFLFDARIFREHGIRFDESLPTHSDWECWMRVFALEPESLFLGRPLAIYRKSGPLTGSLTSDPRAMYSGFVSALAKQASVWSRDPVMARLLALKRKKTELDYKRRLPRGDELGPSPVDWMARAYARTVPWPLQQAVSRLREAHLRPDARLLLEISRGGT